MSSLERFTPVAVFLSGKAGILYSKSVCTSEAIIKLFKRLKSP